MSVYKSHSKIFGKVPLTALVLLAFLAGCGGGGPGSGGTASGGSGGNGGGPPGPPDTTAPTVTGMTPGEDSTGTGTNSKITATLSESMVEAIIIANNPPNFRLAQGDNSIPGTVSYDSTNHIAVFTPSAALTPNTRYTATIITGIKDLGNNSLIRDFAWCFVTGATADNTAPSVTSTATNVAVNGKITATFSKDMDGSTITPANFTVTGPGAAQVSGSVTYLRRTAVFTPSSGLATDTYTATITTGAMDLAGNPSQAKVWSFTTGANADVTAPAVMSTSPASDASGVAIGSTITVTLSEPMDPATITTENFTVTVPGATPGAPAVRVIGTVDANNNTATFTRIDHLTTPVAFHPTPVSNLESNTTYTATLTTGAKDMAGNALASNWVWSFKTAP